jgi:hypothetical protein
MAGRRNVIIGCVGRRGSGKSTVLRRLLETCPRLAVLDVVGEHTWLPNQMPPADWERFFAWSHGRDRWAAACIPEDLDSDVPAFARLIYERGDCVVGWEELPMYSAPGHLDPALDKIIRLGRHRRISLIWTAQRAAEVPRRVTAATDWFILFRQTEPRDLDALEERCGPGVRERIGALGAHDYLVWDVVAGGQAELAAIKQALAETF